MTSPGAIGYWRRRNLVAFPTDFEPTLEWQRGFARRAIEDGLTSIIERSDIALAMLDPRIRYD